VQSREAGARQRPLPILADSRGTARVRAACSDPLREKLLDFSLYPADGACADVHTCGKLVSFPVK